ncbi:hypothetical protein HOE67_04655 [Candidatus Peregrinibacteria bacterium]|jgi:hypothetical protein|nr:hypothetical protein [Candidatus Peregrinibacteria bacterium]MBT4056372.1 hypothetical protein [Candidatus Peregrinibacteria bacterium]
METPTIKDKLEEALALTQAKQQHPQYSQASKIILLSTLIEHNGTAAISEIQSQLKEANATLSIASVIQDINTKILSQLENPKIHIVKQAGQIETRFDQNSAEELIKEAQEDKAPSEEDIRYAIEKLPKSQLAQEILAHFLNDTTLPKHKIDTMIENQSKSRAINQLRRLFEKHGLSLDKVQPTTFENRKAPKTYYYLKKIPKPTHTRKRKGPRQIGPKRLARQIRQDFADISEEDIAALAKQRPKTRGECVDGPRPCRWVACRHHLYLDVSPNGKSLILNFPDADPDNMPESCSLDLAAQGKHSLREVGRHLNITKARAHSITNDLKTRFETES